MKNSKDPNKLDSYWKTPGREVYSQTLWDCIKSTIYCHVWLRIFRPKLPNLPLGCLVAFLALALVACSSTQLASFDASAVTALSAINSDTSAAIASGALPSGSKAAGIVNDANTISAGLETLLTGQPITTKQATDVATSFKSNSSTTAYASLVPLIVNPLVSLINAKIASGATPAQVQTAAVQTVANAPAAVQAATVTASN